MSFLAMVGVERADAPGVYNAILTALNQFSNSDPQEIKAKLIAFGSDGASVNTGQENGVIALMRRNISPSIILVHCLAHRLELACKDVFKDLALYKTLTTLLTTLFAFYKQYLQRSNLKTSFKTLNLPVCMPTRVGGTRSISHTLTALEKLWGGYPAYVQHLQQAGEMGDSKTKVKAKGLLKLLSSKSLITFAHFYQDVLITLSKMSRELQRRDVTLHECVEQLQVTTASIRKQKDRSGHYLKLIKANTQEFQGNKLIGNEMRESAVPEVLDKVIQCLGKRYQDLDGNPVLAATTLTDFKTWPAELQEGFGDDKVESIVHHYEATLKQAGVDLPSVLLEWTGLLTAIYNNHKLDGLQWTSICTAYKDKFPNMLCLIDLLLTLPASTAECERGFSQMKLMKTAYRNRLQDKTMSDLMTVHLMSSEIKDFDPEPSVRHWYTAKQRRKEKIKQPNLALAHIITAESKAEHEAESEVKEPQSADQAGSSSDAVEPSADAASESDDDSGMSFAESDEESADDQQMLDLDLDEL